MDIKTILGTVPKITKYSISSKKIPENFNGFKIAHISDSHSRPKKGIFELINSENPDIICITGDMMHDDDNTTCEFEDLLIKCLNIAPVYMVTGNHDLWRFDGEKKLKEYSNQGAIILDGKSASIEKCEEKITLYGIGDPFSKVPEVIKRNIEQEYSKLTKTDGFNILLFHRANLFDIIKNHGFDLILAGHMHGGQIRLPYIGGTLSPKSSVLSNRMLFPKYWGGSVTFQNTTMIVNCGISNTTIIPRLNNPPEVGIIELKKSSS